MTAGIFARACGTSQLRRRRGEFFSFPDMFAFILFIAVMAIMFFFFIYPQYVKSSGSPAKISYGNGQVTTASLDSDASVIATTLPRLEALDASGNPQGTLGDTIRMLAHDHATMSASDFDKALAASDYGSTLDKTFTAQMFPIVKGDKDPIIHYAVVLSDQSGYWMDTCREYVPTGVSANYGCSVFNALSVNPPQAVVDQTTGIMSWENAQGSSVPIFYTHIDTSYVPTPDGPVTVNVLEARALPPS